jgi:hypothetical protein
VIELSASRYGTAIAHKNLVRNIPD